MSKMGFANVITQLDNSLISDTVPTAEFESGRLKDIMEILDTKMPTVINLDALIPAGDKGVAILNTVLAKLPESVKTLSLRFNKLTMELTELLLPWLLLNNTLETLYLMGTLIDNPTREKYDAAWKKNLFSHRTDNLGFTFIRVAIDPKEAAALKAAAEGK